VSLLLVVFLSVSVLEVVVPAGSLIGRAGIIGGEIVELGSVRRPGNIRLDWRIHQTMSELAKVEIAQEINLSYFFDPFSRSKSSFWVWMTKKTNELSRIRADLTGELDSANSAVCHFVCCLVGISPEWRLAGQQLEKENSNRPEIAAEAVRPLVNYFWRHIT
jgi:hypothetical protein